MFRDHPVLGVGLGGWRRASRDLVQNGMAAPMVLDYNQAHTLYLDALATRGALGLAMFFAMVGFLGYAVWPAGGGDREPFRVLALTSTVAFLFSGLTDTLVLIRGVYMAYLLLIGLSFAVIFGRTEGTERN
jgi:O-antigen ligase